VFALVQFKDQDSVLAQISFSKKQPFGATLIAVFEKLLRDFKLNEEAEMQSQIMGRMVAAEQERQKEVQTRAKITKGITH
jgi:hypothetical protein